MFLRGDKDGKVEAREANRLIRELEKRINEVRQPYKGGAFKPGNLVLPTSVPDGAEKGTVYYDYEADEIRVYRG